MAHHTRHAPQPAPPASPHHHDHRPAARGSLADRVVSCALERRWTTRRAAVGGCHSPATARGLGATMPVGAGAGPNPALRAARLAPTPKVQRR
jgi:hypothetical protein